MSKRPPIPAFEASEKVFKTALLAAESVVPQLDGWVYCTVPYPCSYVSEGKPVIARYPTGRYVVRGGPKSFTIFGQPKPKLAVRLVATLWTT